MPPIDEAGRDSTGIAPSALQQYLFDLALFGVKLGLHNIEYLLEQAGHPERAAPIVHIGGTNGKGSVVAILDAMLRSAGYRVGRFTSPHLIRVNERFAVDGQPISDAALDEHLAFFKCIADTMAPPPSFFEMNTAVALRHFAQEAVDAVLLEVGLGGRLDATNAVTPMLSIITNIDLDHQEWLGDTLAKIALEKAGIIKEGVPVVLGERKPESLGALLESAAARHAPVLRIGRDFDVSVAGDAWHQTLHYISEPMVLRDCPISLAGPHQAENAAVAIAAALKLADLFPKLDEQAIRRGLATAQWPCRLERVLESPPIIIDVAHNAAGAHILAQCLGPSVIVFAASADKDVDGMLACLGPLADPLIVTAFTGKRALDPASLAGKARPWNPIQCASLPEAIALGMKRATARRPLVITGSIYTAGEARAILTRDWGAKQF